MSTNISIMDNGYNLVSQPVMGMYALYQQPVAQAPVEPKVEDDAVSAEADCQAKVVAGPAKAAPKAAKATSADVVTK